MRRRDFGLLIVVGVLFAAMTFHLGLYWGVKWGMTHSPQVQQHPSLDTGHAIYESLKAKADTKKDETVVDDWHTRKQIPKSLTESFVKSKQNALTEVQLRSKDRKPVGTSIADARAYFQEKKLKWGEVPKEVKELERNLASEESAAQRKATSTKVTAPNGLFERSPASVKSFSPVPGEHTVQVASYATEDEASARVKALIAAGASEAYYTTTKVRGDTWYQVSVGSYKDAKWAKKTGDQLVRRQLASEYFVRKIP